MCEEAADFFPFILEQAPAGGDVVGPSPRERVVKGLGGSVAWAVVLHALLAAAVVLLPFMFPKRNVPRRSWTVSLVDGARLGGEARAPGEVSGNPAGEASAGAAAVAPAARDAMKMADVAHKIDLPDSPKEESKKPIRAVAKPVFKPRTAAARNAAKLSRSHRRSVHCSKVVHRARVPHVPKAARNASEDSSGSEQGRIITTGKGAGGGEGTGGPAGCAPSGADSQEAANRAFSDDRPPEAVRKCEPVYPERARELGISGKVVVKFLVNPVGLVARPVVIQAHPKGVFDQSALDAILKWRFKPAKSRGKPVGAWVILPFQFQLSSKRSGKQEV